MNRYRTPAVVLGVLTILAVGVSLTAVAVILNTGVTR